MAQWGSRPNCSGSGESLRTAKRAIVQELVVLEKHDREEQDAEARAFRLASRGTVSEEVLNQEIGLIQTRQRWIAEQRQRLEEQLSDVRRSSFDPHNIAMLRQRLEARLETATPEDRRYILDALGVQADGVWEQELQVPSGKSLRSRPLVNEDLLFTIPNNS